MFGAPENGWFSSLKRSDPDPSGNKYLLTFLLHCSFCLLINFVCLIPTEKKVEINYISFLAVNIWIRLITGRFLLLETSDWQKYQNQTSNTVNVQNPKSELRPNPNFWQFWSRQFLRPKWELFSSNNKLAWIVLRF